MVIIYDVENISIIIYSFNYRHLGNYHHYWQRWHSHYNHLFCCIVCKICKIYIICIVTCSADRLRFLLLNLQMRNLMGCRIKKNMLQLSRIMLMIWIMLIMRILQTMQTDLAVQKASPAGRKRKRRDPKAPMVTKAVPAAFSS